MQIEGSTILVTGASSGIGAALAPMLAERGATVGIVARRRERLEEVLERCRVHAPDSRLWAADLGDLDGATAVARDAWETFDGLDALVNNAAIPKRTPVQRLTTDDVDLLVRVDFLSPAHMTLAVLSGMLERGSGTIVNVSSLGGRIPIIHEAAYNAAKYAVCGWSEALAVDLAGTGVDVKLVLPGPIETEIWDLPDNDPALFELELVPAADCAAGIVEALQADGFEHYVPPVYPGGLDAKAMVVDKARDCDTYVRGMGEMARSLGG